ncbi:MAG: Undecaprenyl-diphosphatase [Candidatus Collierbacteria bacterium GW2011_GWC2_44_30]|nr:MAG: Undecaprenyl-diphosphatase [Candidatus Collierbacteria bacterium GW2011_GWC2_44_30]
MTIFQAIILSIVEGLTEFLPVSSTGHLLLTQQYLSVASSEFSKTFDIVIQFAAILAVVWLYRKNLFSSIRIWRQSLIAFIPTGIIGILLYKLIRTVLLERPIITVYALFWGGLALLAVDRIKKLRLGQKESLSLSVGRLFSIGLFQSISVIGGLVSGLSRSQAVEFSFFLAIPTMLAATGYDLLKSGLYFSPQEYLILLTGCLFSFLSATVAVKTFIRFVKDHDFTYFAIYRIILAFIVWITLKP